MAPARGHAPHPAGPPGESRYAALLKLASGGMATVWIGTMRGGMGFRQLVAIKKPHPHLLDHPELRAELLAEAALASSIRHANVVDVRDVEVRGDEISLVMDYIEGASLAELLTRSQQGGPRLTPALAVRICLDALAGLQAAHDLCDDRGRHVGLVHRDISPQNILVGIDGLARVVDFGVAKFDKKGDATTQGQLKGKIAYMAPEYLRNEPIDRRLDIFAMGVVLWESLTAQRLFRGSHDIDTMQRVLQDPAIPVSRFTPEARGLEGVLDGALAKRTDERFQSAAAMADALESAARSAGLVAGARELGEFVRAAFGEDLEQRRVKLREKLADQPSVASLFAGVKEAVKAPPVAPMLEQRTLPLAGSLEQRTLPLAGSLERTLPLSGETSTARTLPLSAPGLGGTLLSAGVAPPALGVDAVDAAPSSASRSAAVSLAPRLGPASPSRAGAWIAGGGLVALALVVAVWRVLAQPSSATPGAGVVPTTSARATAPGSQVGSAPSAPPDAARSTAASVVTASAPAPASAPPSARPSAQPRAGSPAAQAPPPNPYGR